MLNILITGANGQLGSELKELAPRYKHSFYFASKNKLDISDYKAVLGFVRTNKISHIINCAAYTGVDLAEQNEALAMNINASAVSNLAQICSECGTYLIHISTDYVFSGKTHKPYTPDDKCEPLGVYGRSKLAGETAIVNQANLNAIIIRTSWVYSKFGKNFLKTMLNLFAQKDELNVVADQIGSPTYARDLACFVLTTLGSFKSGVNIYHYANEGVCSWFDFAHAIAELSDANCKINAIKSEHYPTAAKRPYYSVLDCSKTKMDFDIQIPYFRDSLKDCLERLCK